MLHTLSGHSGNVLCVAATFDSRAIVSGGHDGIRVWDLESGRPLRVFPEAMGAAWSFAVAPDMKVLVSGGEHGEVWEFAGAAPTQAEVPPERFATFVRHAYRTDSKRSDWHGCRSARARRPPTRALSSRMPAASPRTDPRILSREDLRLRRCPTICGAVHLAFASAVAGSQAGAPGIWTSPPRSG